MQLASTKRSHPCTRKMSAGVKAKVMTALSVWAGWLLCSLLLHRLLPASASFSFFLDTCAWHCLIFYKLVFEQPATPLGTVLAFWCCLKTFYLFPSLLCPLSSLLLFFLFLLSCSISVDYIFAISDSGSAVAQWTFRRGWYYMPFYYWPTRWWWWNHFSSPCLSFLISKTLLICSGISW